MFGRGVFQFWIGDAIGILVTAPVLMRLHRWRPPSLPAAPHWSTRCRPPRSSARCAIVFGLGGAAVRAILLSAVPAAHLGEPARRRVPGASLALLAIQLGIVVAVHAQGYDLGTLLELQILMMTIALTALFLGAVVSDRRRAQEDLARSLRLAAAAETASSLAHELNQPLSAIGTYVRACSLMLDDPTANRALLARTMGTVVEEVARAGDVVRRLRDFFRSGSLAVAARAGARPHRRQRALARAAADPPSRHARGGLRAGPARGAGRSAADRDGAAQPRRQRDRRDRRGRRRGAARRHPRRARARRRAHRGHRQRTGAAGRTRR